MSIKRYDLIAPAGRDSRLSAKLLYLSRAQYGGDWHSMPHSYACAELFYITGGRGQFQIENRLCPVQEHDLVVINPQVRHTEQSLGTEPLRYIVLGVDGLSLMSDGGSVPPCCVINFSDSHSDILMCLRAMLEELELKAPGYDTVCQDLLDILLVRLVRRSDFLAKLIPGNLRVSRESAAVRRYIEGHFRENVSLDDLAEIARLNKFHMTHLFTRDYGVSPIKFLLNLRIQESCYLLRSSDKSLSQIAQATGFSSPSYFSQSFRKAQGMSPTDYRREQKILLGHED